MLSDAKRKDALGILKETYPDAKPALHFSSPFELLVATMLSAQCTDKQVNKCTDVLFPLYNTPEQFAALDFETLEPYIKSCGFYRMKGMHIIEMSRILVEQYGGKVPKTREELTKLPGVGRKNTGLSWQEFLATDTGKAVLEQVRLVNVFTFLKDETSVPALYWYVRYGLRDRDSSFAIETMLYYGMLGKKGILDRNFRLAYLFHHSGDYDVIEAYDWLQEKLKEAGEPA